MNKAIYRRLKQTLKDFSRAVSTGYLYCRHTLFVRIKRWGNAVVLAALRMSRTIKTMCGMLITVFKNFIRAGSRGYPYYRHPLPVRIMHWSNVVFLAILLMSGLNILSAHPALYWGKSSYHGVPPLLEIRGQENDKGEISGVTRILGHDFDTTGFLGASERPGGRINHTWIPVLAYHTRLAMACHGAAMAFFFRLAPSGKRHRLCDLLLCEQAFAP